MRQGISYSSLLASTRRKPIFPLPFRFRKNHPVSAKSPKSALAPPLLPLPSHASREAHILNPLLPPLPPPPSSAQKPIRGAAAAAAAASCSWGRGGGGKGAAPFLLLSKVGVAPSFSPSLGLRASGGKERERSPWCQAETKAPESS